MRSEPPPRWTRRKRPSHSVNSRHVASRGALTSIKTGASGLRQVCRELCVSVRWENQWRSRRQRAVRILARFPPHSEEKSERERDGGKNRTPSARRRRREFLDLFGQQRAVGLPDHFGQGEVPHLEIVETLKAAPLELGVGVGGDHGVADREAVRAH